MARKMWRCRVWIDPAEIDNLAWDSFAPVDALDVLVTRIYVHAIEGDGVPISIEGYAKKAVKQAAIITGIDTKPREHRRRAKRDIARPRKEIYYSSPMAACNCSLRGSGPPINLSAMCYTPFSQMRHTGLWTGRKRTRTECP
jgi:hypothetical protein